MKYLPWLLVVALAFAATLAVVTRPDETQAVAKPSLSERIMLACKPWLVDDWWVLEQHPEYLRVSCYDPRTSRLRYVMVLR